ncbi:cytosine/adenosine deaminase-related metal-dependent hydrolase [Paenarthrobacter nitroguajacolicus]|uniref:chlorohydrolase family protein n=1 Tax=Paenarthrobacter nitroguajacolicus TaxID=211146 RepID=UPI00285FF68F|nr:chlorohydrolase family protein [Paenarthrobacter nitroguajacolicus]MDR6986268.1 cytosine/adenosine deaminase-related metal-dependent hydrolase [Paenarthrobacter nitroguajacolicus]
MPTKVTARYVLGHHNGRHVLLEDACVVYSGDTIDYVGHDYSEPVDEERHLGEALLMPGLIDLDALTDIDHLILDSWAGPDQAKGHQWSEDYFRNRRANVFTADERQQVREYALIQLVLHGITTYMPIASEVHSEWAEPFEELVGMANTSRRLGLRAYLGPAYRSGVNVVLENGDRSVMFDAGRGREGLADALRFLDHATELDDPLVNGVLLPCRIETLDIELLKETAAASTERDALVRLHSLQGLVERQLILDWHRVAPLELLDQVGLLNEHLLIPHATYTDRNPAVFGEDRGDLARLADSGASIIHCPLTSMRYGSTLDSFTAYKEAGINISLGTDSFPPDLIRGMDAGVQLAKILAGSNDAGDVAGYFDAATLGGAQALRRPDLGRLEPGATADLVAFSLGDIRDGVHEDPLRTLLLNGTARQAVLSVVAGRAIMTEGRIAGLDLEYWRSRGQELFETMRRAYTARDIRNRPADELFPPVYARLER